MALAPGISPTTLEDQRNPPQTESDFTRARSQEQFNPDATTNRNLYANLQPVDIDTIRDDIFEALKDGMVGKKSEEIILLEVVSKIWAQNRHRKFYVNQAWYDPEWDRTNFMEEMIQIMSILIRINFRHWKRFGAVFVGHGDRRDQNIPFELKKLQQDGFLGRSEGALFYENQFAFCPIPIPEQEDEFVLNSEERLPWIDEPKFVGEGGFGQVNKRTVAKGFLRFQDCTTNVEPRAVAVETISGKDARKGEFNNLKELRQCLSDHIRIMVNLVTMVEKSSPNDIYHIVYELAAYDLNVFLTKMRHKLRKRRHATATPERTGSANMWPGDLISESVNLADALDYLHNRLYSTKLHSSLSHNDIKPENILVVYPETTTKNELYPVGQ
ncbi:uncharacterized protein J4E87_009877 [Alternaria ethzedia]|uniref:uncharacterized protein n=1 Tax=Alternaria ethzedia TaxID=181014 RepID=UPI0020C1D32D|nr:uncharacterized protein J4E87_009877 [Alternaria ethzedia]KAI4613410.1 hypothetical protein J4E87_009877 [Alternaria ethzedia]